MTARLLLRVPDGPPQADDEHCEERSTQWVVLVHGLFASRRSMRKLQSHLADMGYQTLNWGYPTLLQTTDRNVARLAAVIERLQLDPRVSAIHFVTHSMGGILVRGALHLHHPGKVQRIVMLAPPNRGSRLTRLPMGTVGKLLPCINDLQESPACLPQRLVMCPRVEVGVIAAERDVVVSLAATHFDGQREHCTVDSNHFRLPTHALAIRRAGAFIAAGSFANAGTEGGSASATAKLERRRAM